MNNDLVIEHEALLQFLYLAPVGLIQTSLDGEIGLINPLSAQLLSPLQHGALFSNFFSATEMVAPELRNLAQDFTEDSGVICKGLRFPVTAERPGKKSVQVLEISLIKLDQRRLMAVISDVSAIVKREQQLKQSEAWLDAILVGVHRHAAIPLDKNGCVTSWNQGIQTLTGFCAADVVGKPYSFFFKETAISAERAMDYLHEANESGWSLHECWCVKAGCDAFWGCNLIASVEANDQGGFHPMMAEMQQQGFLMIIRDMTDRRASTFELLRASMTDHLSGVMNRRAFFEAAEREMARYRRYPRPMSLLAIDADHFKQINDEYGHATGDLVLQKLAEIIAETAREIDIVARIGGEEFAVLLPSTGPHMAYELAERIRFNISSQCMQIEGNDIGLTVSIGISTMDSAAQSFDALMKSADNAMYKAKQTGRNQSAFWTDLPKQLPRDCLS
ncbi:MAG: sensor domain-containing diguanylate cyclase [Herminiimonas sp.]|nr:sensor domain-containing diguanylate cyclase [Herminiimonas sp.]